MPPSLEEAAEILGASRPAVPWYVVLPLLRPGLAAGGLFAFLVSFDSLPLSFFFGSPDHLTQLRLSARTGCAAAG